MPDIADLAEEHIERELEQAIAAARGIPAQPRVTCCDCAEDLESHRTGYGICLPCQVRRERQQRLRGWR